MLRLGFTKTVIHCLQALGSRCATFLVYAVLDTLLAILDEGKLFLRGLDVEGGSEVSLGTPLLISEAGQLRN